MMTRLPDAGKDGTPSPALTPDPPTLATGTNSPGESLRVLELERAVAARDARIALLGGEIDVLRWALSTCEVPF